MKILSLIDSFWTMVFRFWLYIAQCLIIMLVVLPFIPGVPYFQFIQGIVDVIVVAPAAFMFEYFGSYIEHFRNASSVNGFHAFANLCLMLGCIILALGLPALFWFGWIMVMFAGAYSFIPNGYIDSRIASGDDDTVSGDLMNDWYLLNGWTTVQDVFDSNVQAQAIASAMRRHKS